MTNYILKSTIAAIIINMDEELKKLEFVPAEKKTLKQSDDYSYLLNLKTNSCELYDSLFDDDDTDYGQIWMDALPFSLIPERDAIDTIKIVMSYCDYLMNKITKREFEDNLIDWTPFDTLNEFTEWYEIA